MKEALYMDLIDKRVRHKVFGVGKICELRDDVVAVQFGSEVKKFVFPDAFKEYLIMTEKRSRDYVDDLLDKMDAEIALEREAAILTEEKRRALDTLPLHTNSQAAFKCVENEKQRIFENGAVFTGNYLSGANRGNPRKPSRVYPNSVCLLTSCGEKESEENRIIWGAYMVRDDFVGPDCSDGLIPAHERYRIVLNEAESSSLLFWDFMDSSGSQHLKWGSTEMKYFSNKTMADILNNILSMKRGTDDERLCKDFLRYFCKLNKIDRLKL